MEFAEFISVPNVKDAQYFHKDKATKCTLCLTGHHLIISCGDNAIGERMVLYKSIDAVQITLPQNVTPGTLNPATIDLRLKDFSALRLRIPSSEEGQAVAESLRNLSNIDTVTAMFPFSYRVQFEMIEDGWESFLPEIEFAKVFGHHHGHDEWRLSHVNKDYKICNSYSTSVVVPKYVSDDLLIQSASFRQYGRFPVLSYFHSEKNTSLVRCSQPKVGPTGRRCKADEQVLDGFLLRKTDKKAYIVDTRKEVIAKSAQQKGGGGFEPNVHYPHFKRIHHAIDRCEAFRDSLIKLIEAVSDPNLSMDKYLSKLNASNWLQHVKDILTCACNVGHIMDREGCTVIVHGSEGMDTTLQVTSLTQVILNPDCRTIRGFEALIEREWLQAGHPFQERCFNSAYSLNKSKRVAPTFLLFLDCTWQVFQQFPCSFEFNEDFLVTLFEHSYFSSYGTFLCNSDFERRSHKLSSRTVSLWSYINQPDVLLEFINPMYEPNSDVIWPSVAPHTLQLWTDLYLRYQTDQAPKRLAFEQIALIKEKEKEIKSRAVKLRRQLAALEGEALQAGLIAAEPLTP